LLFPVIAAVLGTPLEAGISINVPPEPLPLDNHNVPAASTKALLELIAPNPLIRGVGVETVTTGLDAGIS
jgi:hypothetical protein